MRKFNVQARRWFQKSFGNTYHSVSVTDESGQVIGQCDCAYGYGSQFITTASNIIAEHMKTTTYNQTPVLGETYDFTYTVADVPCKRDLTIDWPSA